MRIDFRAVVSDLRTGLTIALSVLFFAACSDNQHSEQPSKMEPSSTAQTRNPLPDLIAAANHGRSHYIANCAICHGDTGKGQAGAGGALSAKPTDLSTGEIASAPDGRIFLAIKNGIKKDGKVIMPPARQLTDEEIWQVVAYVRTLAGK